MQGHIAHGVAYYRCRFPQEYALANRIAHPRDVYLREDAPVGRLDAWLATLFAPHRRDTTIDTLLAADTPAIDPIALRVRTAIKDCDAKLDRYRQALDAGADPAVVAGWISQVQADRARAEAELTRAPDAAASHRRLSRAPISELVTGIADAIAVLATADPADKAEVYRQLGLRLTYRPETETVGVQAHLDGLPWGSGSCPRGDRYPNPTDTSG
jgi:site-specific DNA recombinase